MDRVGSGWRAFFNPTRPCGVEKYLIHHEQKLTLPNPQRSGCVHHVFMPFIKLGFYQSYEKKNSKKLLQFILGANLPKPTRPNPARQVGLVFRAWWVGLGYKIFFYSGSGWVRVIKFQAHQAQPDLTRPTPPIYLKYII